MSEVSMSTAPQLLCAGGSYLPLLVIFLFCFLISDLTYFLPYFLNLLHFLSPLLFTTFIIFLFTSYNTTFIHNPLPGPNNIAGELHKLEEHQVYKIFFEAASQFELLHQDDETTDHELESEQLVDKFLICVNPPTQDRNPPLDEELFHDHQSCDIVVSSEKDQVVKEIDTDNYSRMAVLRESKEEVINEAVSDKECVSSRTVLLEEKSSSNKVEYEKMMSMRSVGSYGSMRVDKEWKRTLACKLFEERHNNNINAGEEEGMDLLWEAYEESNNTFSANHENNKKKKNNILEKKKKRWVGSSAKSSSYKDNMDADEHDDEDEEEEEVMGGKICCLQALKFSAGKMNMGMGRPNIGRISKAFRGIGWLHHVSTKKSSSSLRH